MPSILQKVSVYLASTLLFGAATLQDSHGQGDWSVHPTTTFEFLYDVTYSEPLGKYIVIGDAGTILSSTDATSWNNENSGTANGLRSVLFAGGQFVATGQTGTILTSSDGASWVARSSGVDKFISGIAYGAGLYVAVGGSGTILTSADGITWSPADSGTSRFLQKIRFFAGKFIAVGSGGTIRTSDNGTDWSVATIGRTEILTAVTHFGGSWYIAGQAGLLLKSTDGIDWEQVASGTNVWIRAFASDGDRLIAVGEEGIVRLSFDGERWTDIDSGVDKLLVGCGVWDNQFIAVGEPTSPGGPAAPVGLIMTSPQAQFVYWESHTATVVEGDLITIDLVRSAPVGGATPLDLSTADGTASSSSDFTPPPIAVQFPDGVDRISVEIPTHNNLEVEPPETFEIMFSIPDGEPIHAFLPATLYVTIIDAQDSDSDDLLDAWEIEHFGNVDDFGPADDPDGDGNDNAREFSDDTDPASATSALYTLDVSVAIGTGQVVVSPIMEKYSAGEIITFAPVPEEGFAFASWSGNATGENTPLQYEIRRDSIVTANFTISLSGALDTESQEIAWSNQGIGGSPWIAQVEGGFDGGDAAFASGGGAFSSATIATQIYGPAKLSFYWMFESSPDTVLEFLIDGAPTLVISDSIDWTRLTLPVPAGQHQIAWRYRKGSSGSPSTGRAGLDLVSIDNSYDVWAMASFDPADIENTEVIAADADPDGDGYDNLLEYLLDSSPILASTKSPSLPLVTFADVDGISTPTLNFQFVGARIAPYQIEAWVSGDLTTGWEPLPLPATQPGIGLQQVQIFDQGGTNRRYYRLSARENALE